jgi:autotransporter adhesin
VGTQSTAYGQGATAYNTGSVAIGQGAVSGASSGFSVANTTAIGTNAAATGNNSVALGAGSVATRANSVSVGSRQITDISAGVAPTDAVNVQQLDTATNALDNQVNTLDTRLNLVGAMSAAISGLAPLPYDPKAPLQFLLGAGSYSGRQALAAGVSYYESDSLDFNLGFSMGGEEKMGRIGAAWKVGWGQKCAAAEKVSESQPSSIATLQTEIQHLTAQNQKMQEQINQLKQMMENNGNKSIKG